MFFLRLFFACLALQMGAAQAGNRWNIASVLWSMHPEFDKDVAEAAKFFQRPDFFNIPKAHIFEMTSFQKLVSLRPTLREALHAIEHQEGPELIVYLDTHGNQGVAGRVGQRSISLKRLLDHIFREIRGFKTPLRVRLIYHACYSGSLIPVLEEKIKTAKLPHTFDVLTSASAIHQASSGETFWRVVRSTYSNTALGRDLFEPFDVFAGLDDLNEEIWTVPQVWSSWRPIVKKRERAAFHAIAQAYDEKVLDFFNERIQGGIASGLSSGLLADEGPPEHQLGSFMSALRKFACHNNTVLAEQLFAIARRLFQRFVAGLINLDSATTGLLESASQKAIECLIPSNVDSSIGLNRDIQNWKKSHRFSAVASILPSPVCSIALDL